MATFNRGRRRIRQEELEKKRSAERGLDSFHHLTQPSGAVPVQIYWGRWALKWKCGVMGGAATSLRCANPVSMSSPACKTCDLQEAPFLLCLQDEKLAP